jgi:hypothetical protein
MSGNIGDCKIFHTNSWDNPEHKRFNRDVVAAVDPFINFSGGEHWNSSCSWRHIFRCFETRRFKLALIRPKGRKFPLPFRNIQTPIQNPNKTQFANLTPPAWWIHEAISRGDLVPEDHYGDGRRDVNTECGLGWWSLINPTTGDLAIWEKWILGFTLDSQVQCLTSVGSSTHWLHLQVLKLQKVSW